MSQVREGKEMKGRGLELAPTSEPQEGKNVDLLDTGLCHTGHSPRPPGQGLESLSWPVRLGRVGFILGLKAPIPQEIQFRPRAGM